jgi:hypothetical protein
MEATPEIGITLSKAEVIEQSKKDCPVTTRRTNTNTKNRAKRRSLLRYEFQDSIGVEHLEFLRVSSYAERKNIQFDLTAGNLN